MSYKMRFPNDWVFTEVNGYDGFEPDREFEDCFFGWFGHRNRLYVQVPKPDYERWLKENEEQ